MIRRFLRTPSSFPNDPRGFAFNQVTDRDTHEAQTHGVRSDFLA